MPDEGVGFHLKLGSPRRRPMSWTDERVELLKKFWADGLVRQPDRGRIGRDHPKRRDRQGSPPWPIRPRQKPVLKHATAAQSALVRTHDPGAAAVITGQYCARLRLRGRSRTGMIEIPIEQRKTLLQLNEKTCRWPVGDPGGGNSSSAAAKAQTTSLIAPSTAASPINRLRPPARQAAVPELSGWICCRCRWPG